LSPDRGAGDLDAVVVAKLDRFSRSLRHLVDTVPELEDAGVAFGSVAESIDGTTATGRLFRSVAGAFAELERDRIAERMLEGHQRTAEAGGWTGGPTLVGYGASSEGHYTMLEHDEDGEADTVRLAVELVLDHGVSCYEEDKETVDVERVSATDYRTANRLQANESVHVDVDFSFGSSQPEDLRYRLSWVDGRGEQTAECRVPIWR
jgi:DNA invertase Pin-like site-specific DNA recombinase